MYAIVSDIHANASALEAVDEDVRQLRSLRNQKIRYWFLGDLVGYGPDPIECIKWLKTRARIGGRWIPGNHDEWLIRPTRFSEDATASLTRHQETLEETVNQRLANWFFDEIREAVTEENRSLVEEKWKSEQLQAVFIHAALQHTQRRTTYLRPWENHKINDTFERFKREHQSEDTAVLFCGHTHFPMWFVDKKLRPIAYERPLELEEGVHIINPGSVGQPRDGDPRAAYVLFDPQQKTIEFRRISYEVTAVAERLHERGYPSSLAERVVSGDGRGELQQFLTVYQRPEWDLDIFR